MIDTSFWKNKRVFITGHTGFKGSWLSLWLNMLGAKVTGYALESPTDPSLFDAARVSAVVDSTIADIRDYERLRKTISDINPEIIFHMAAQPLVRSSYANPAETYAVNVMGTVNLLEAVRQCGGVYALVNVTTDKVYENHEQSQGYSETEPLGGFDPYSNSKACSELVTAAYRSSFFMNKESGENRLATCDLQLVTSIATARAGNVIGGGDWSTDRLIPDCVRALSRNEKIIIRNPGSVRPWQFVLEPLSGYLLLAEKLCRNGREFASAWNFGPDERDQKPVSYIADLVCRFWGNGAEHIYPTGNDGLHEAGLLTLNSSKAHSLLGWKPRLNLDQALEITVEWYKRFFNGERMDAVCREQIEKYSENL